MQRPVNTFSLKRVTTMGSPLLNNTRRDWLLGNCVVTRLYKNRRGFLCGPCLGHNTRAVGLEREVELGSVSVNGNWIENWNWEFRSFKTIVEEKLEVSL
jgi:hypothetical protein